VSGGFQTVVCPLFFSPILLETVSGHILQEGSDPNYSLLRVEAGNHDFRKIDDARGLH
jgi:hypothetical protein